MSEAKAIPGANIKAATLQLSLQADSGYSENASHRISANQWCAILDIAVDVGAGKKRMAARDMYEALKAILSNHETVGAGASIFQCTAAEVKAARDAIAKAEGRHENAAAKN